MTKRTNHPFRKKWGQNFLADGNLLDRIARTIDPKETDSILEIGPGEGALTERIFPYVDEMAAIEIDPMLIEYLQNRESLKGLHVVHGDILLQEIENIPIKNPVRVIGNIPYNITSPIIFWLIEQLDYWGDAFIMMQKEVAERLSAKVGTKAYGRFTIVVGAYLNMEYCFTIPPDVFIPKPKVDSAIIRFTKKEIPIVSDEKYGRFNKLVATAFSQRRKMLRNTLKGWDFPDSLKEKIDFTRRPESLTIEEFASMV
ncbi:MAG: 16S rRNA (adenine(1518)-N(6)/adenine(1519)-N(6))-dimethyltransferase RsmA [Candidatus Marinimicrobia bacterium]|jgi:16S rRNA (adenine1518-N6/adenine1519-N6)-dimethyltransferase|nr:16S rRNA (adenine(1518)-N(6)/adenine(1519)-N(6))-dimethyltransferase RsmA [Candidatus Neomarinimicrobiota bacterium]MBT4155287.1 16S rRNA (adenine(1518)-N(6)/adenine(1519)-N(6))-dimethyltransferase RsmA [Candidatus Neomarinimicrobiota bacterium]MBT4752098.1 16S rRNA (adenine(1518)-N(6)/adenine(1519)-N(6))-dimethyltransferase RsmA [Candidatus Neomarinimicrobiota bacterium]MBT5748626.1 16S rRNA (adenine(1518)-N(6)/adenine(1519)-N(6))-dimethyltransferase RsmA [Candidatus Neomarinimicrobiota bact